MLNCSTPRLSIVMPLFNNKELVAEMIDSILANSYQDWELLAVDDGSTQETLDFLRHYEEDDRIHIILRDREPKGAPTCRNIGLSKATGKYLCFFDSDDIVSLECLGNRVKELEAHPDWDFAVFPSTIYGKSTLENDDYRSIFGYHIYSDDIAAFCARTLPFVVCNNIYRLESVSSKGLKWDTRLRSLQDAQFNLNALLSGMKYGYSNLPPDYAYRIDTEGSVSKKIHSLEHLDSNIYAVDTFYHQIQAVFGHRYDHDLYNGALYVYMKVVREFFSLDFSLRMAKVICKYSAAHALKFTLQIWSIWLLMKFLPYKLARRIPMLPYLLRVRRHEQKWLPEKIKKQIHND